MANKAKPIPIDLGRRKKRNYHPPKKGDGQDPDKPALEVKAKIPKAPKTKDRRNVLGTEGMREWRRVTKLLRNARVVGEVDRTVLTQYCKLWEQFVNDPADFKAAQHTQLRLCCVELGLTPSSRARFKNG